ncbi:MAG TPA: hypothetical protein VFB38_03465 [Chthonomonadaceae bacterium]|nr:hypothetical protein [Chthonomonadaceae bacterium]
MVDFRDFVPQLLNRGKGFDSFWKETARYESFEDAVAAANVWIAQNCIRVINVETVVLPNIWSPKEEGTQDAALTGTFVPWHQFVRVWFAKEPGEEIERRENR